MPSRSGTKLEPATFSRSSSAAACMSVREARPAIEAHVDPRIEVAAEDAAAGDQQHRHSAALLLVAPREKLAWYRIRIGPTTPSTMCVWNQPFTEPMKPIQRRCLRAGYSSSISIRLPPTMPRK